MWGSWKSILPRGTLLRHWRRTCLNGILQFVVLLAQIFKVAFIMEGWFERVTVKIWCGWLFALRILLPAEYPFKPPNIVFMTVRYFYGIWDLETSHFFLRKMADLRLALKFAWVYQPTMKNHGNQVIKPWITKTTLISFSLFKQSLGRCERYQLPPLRFWIFTWSRAVRTMLEAIISFLPSEGAGAIGALDWTREERQRLAREVRIFHVEERCNRWEINEIISFSLIPSVVLSAGRSMHFSYLSRKTKSTSQPRKSKIKSISYECKVVWVFLWTPRTNQHRLNRSQWQWQRQVM